MGIPIVAGRGFAESDTASLDRVVIVNETLANRLWKGRDPVGQRLRPNLAASMGTSNNAWHTVIGVARDVKEGACIARREPSYTSSSISPRRPSMAPNAHGCAPLLLQ
jgi:hypothetical protein